MKFTIEELIDAAQAADAKATAAFTAVGILRRHYDGDRIIEVLSRLGARKSDQAGRFEARYKARLAALEGELETLREAADDEPSLAKKIEWAADARMYKA